MDKVLPLGLELPSIGWKLGPVLKELRRQQRVWSPLAPRLDQGSAAPQQNPSGGGEQAGRTKRLRVLPER